MTTVAILQRIVPHYRVAFFSGLHRALRERGHELRVVFGDARPGTVPTSVEVSEPWAHRIRNRYLAFSTHELVWQPAWAATRDASLVVVEQANRMVLNHLLGLARVARKNPRVAMWGHGRNFQATAREGISERIKRVLATRADWWFAYTELSAAVFEELGVPRDRITVVDNAIDLDELSDAIARARPDRDVIRRGLGIGASDRVGLFVGGLHAGKRIDFLVDAAVEIRTRVPDFHLLVVGDGPGRDVVEAAARQHPWIHWTGEVVGAARACYLAIGDVMLMPAHVGLVVLDSFVAETPLLTTDADNHSPEVAYLNHGVSSMRSLYTVDAYASMVARVLGEPGLLETLRAGCRRSAVRYGVANMVERFADGIEHCLASAPR